MAKLWAKDRFGRRKKEPPMDVTIYHNPACGTSRKVFALIEAAGITPRVIEYLKTPPSRAELAAIIAKLPGGVRALLRQKAPQYAELGLENPSLPDSQLIDAIMAHPVLFNRPVVISPRGVQLCRPAEEVLSLLET